MTREEHIAKAEELLRAYRDEEPGFGYGTWHPTVHDLARAQAHATLALAAAPGKPVRPLLDPELVGAVEEILAETPRHWWSRAVAR